MLATARVVHPRREQPREFSRGRTGDRHAPAASNLVGDEERDASRDAALRRLRHVQDGAGVLHLVPESAALAERREEDDVADRLAAGEQHRQPVDAEAEAAGRRHPVRERLDVVGVSAHALDVLRLLVEAELLLVGVGDLRVGVAELHAGREVLEPLGERRVVVGRAGERRQLDGIVVDDRRLDQRRLDEVAERVVDELRPVLVGRRVDAALREPGAQLVGIARPELELLERLDEPEPLPRRLQVDLVAPERDDGRRPCTSRATRSSSVSMRAIVSV